jgi:hypothetical protein
MSGQNNIGDVEAVCTNADNVYAVEIIVCKHDCLKEQTFTSDKEADLEHTYKDTPMLMSGLERLAASSILSFTGPSAQSLQLIEMEVTVSVCVSRYKIV